MPLEFWPRLFTEATMNPLRIELSGLTNLDVLELQNYCKASGVEIEVNRPTVSAVGSPHRYGELATATVILVLAPPGMKFITFLLRVNQNDPIPQCNKIRNRPTSFRVT